MAKAKLSPALWAVFILVDVVIVLGVLAAVFWVAPVPPAFASGQTMAQAERAQPTRLVVALVTADSCLACQMYKRGALTDPRVTQWISQNAGAVSLKWGQDQAQIDAIGVTAYPTTVVLQDGQTLASHTGAMSGDDLLAFLNAAAAKAGTGESAIPESSPEGEPEVSPGTPESTPSPAGG